MANNNSNNLNENIIDDMEDSTSEAEASDILAGEFDIDDTDDPTLWAEYMGYVPTDAGGTGSTDPTTTSDATTTSTNGASLSTITSLGQTGNQMAGSIVGNTPPAAVTAAQSTAQSSQASLLDAQDQLYTDQAMQKFYQENAAMDPTGSLEAQYTQAVTQDNATIAADQLAVGRANASVSQATQQAAQTPSLMSQIGTGIMALMLQYEVFQKAEAAAEKAVTLNIAMLGVLAPAADFATMLFLSKLNPMLYAALPTPNVRWGPITVGVPPGPGPGTISAIAAFHHALLVASAITAAIVAAGVLAGWIGSAGAAKSAAGGAVAAFTGAVPDIFSGVPSSAVSFFMGGMTLATLGFTMSPSTLFQQFPVNTVQLAADLTTATGQTVTAANVASKYYVVQGAGQNGADEVMFVEPGANGMSEVGVAQVSPQGYFIGNTGYPAMFTPTVSNGAITGLTQNNAAVNAMQQQNACLAMANSPNLTAAQQQAAISNCASSANHNATFVPTGS